MGEGNLFSEGLYGKHGKVEVVLPTNERLYGLERWAFDVVRMWERLYAKRFGVEEGISRSEGLCAMHRIVEEDF